MKKRIKKKILKKSACPFFFKKGYGCDSLRRLHTCRGMCYEKGSDFLRVVGADCEHAIIEVK